MATDLFSSDRRLAQALASISSKTLSKELHLRREIGRPVGYLELLRSNRGFRDFSGWDR
jgi:hypothetical protein